MTDITWVETAAKTVDEAVALALAELGLNTSEEAQIEVLQEPQRGFLGMGASPAMVRVSPKPKKSSSRRRRSRGGRKRSSSSSSTTQASDSGSRSGSSKAGSSKAGSKSGSSKSESSKSASSKGSSSSRGRTASSSNGGRSKSSQRGSGSSGSQGAKGEKTVETDVDINEQATVVGEFLEGLLTAFGLEGSVATRVEDEMVYADVTGDQTETLVGAKGAVLQAINELTRTVVQRKTQAGVRLRLDIAGYTERRREALRIYAGRLAERVNESGEEIMLEPMNAADRKVVHDAITDIEGVRTFSEGQEPKRYVVIGKDA